MSTLLLFTGGILMSWKNGYGLHNTALSMLNEAITRTNLFLYRPQQTLNETDIKTYFAWALLNPTTDMIEFLNITSYALIRNIPVNDTIGAALALIADRKLGTHRAVTVINTVTAQTAGDELLQQLLLQGYTDINYKTALTMDIHHKITLLCKQHNNPFLQDTAEEEYIILTNKINEPLFQKISAAILHYTNKYGEQTLPMCEALLDEDKNLYYSMILAPIIVRQNEAEKKRAIERTERRKRLIQEAIVKLTTIDPQTYTRDIANTIALIARIEQELNNATQALITLEKEEF